MLVFCPQLLRERMMNEYLCKFEERLCSSGSPLSQLELVEEHMSNKSEDFDEESCIIDGDDLNSNTETEKHSVNELQILYIQCSIIGSSIGAVKTKAKSSLATFSI